MLPGELESDRHPVARAREQHNRADSRWSALGRPYQKPGGYRGECRYRDNRDDEQLPPDAERDPAARTAVSASRIDFCDGASLA